jgi:outer membrane protein TolC
VFSNWNNYSYIGISISKPLLSLKIQSVGKEEKLKLQNDKENYKLNQENLKLRYENAKTSSSSAYSSFKSAKDNMNFAKNLLDVTFFQYQKGVVSLTDYLNDDTAYKNAQSNYVGSLYNVMISELNFNKAQGTLLEFVNQIK